MNLPSFGLEIYDKNWSFPMRVLPHDGLPCEASRLLGHLSHLKWTALQPKDHGQIVGGHLVLLFQREPMAMGDRLDLT